jgi:DASS family divalent anion:Na+ symporter
MALAVRSACVRPAAALRAPALRAPAARLAARPALGRPAPRRAAPPPPAASAAAAAAAPAPVSPAAWPGAKPAPLAASLALGLALRFLVPAPAGISPQGWSLLAIFTSTIAGLVLEPLPVGAWAFLSVTAAVATGTLPFAAAFGAFTNDVIWLIVVSFFFAKGFEKTGLGERVAQLFVRAFGRSTLGLAYSLAVAEAALAPAMPSTTARAGGVFMPIIASLAASAGSKPSACTNCTDVCAALDQFNSLSAIESVFSLSPATHPPTNAADDPSRTRLGAFLVATQLQSSVHSSALFLTAAAQNLLCLKIAAEMGVAIPNAWVTWFKAALVPALLGLIITPAIMYRAFPPEVKETPEAPRLAAARLEAMGPMSRDERVMLGTMAGAVALWVAGDALGVAPVTTAMLGLCALLLSGVLTWRECLTLPAAWDTLFWFAVLVGMSGQLNALGVIAHFAAAAGAPLAAAGLAWPAAFALLNGAYFLLHYLFASQTAHVGALYSAFLAMMLAAGVPGVAAALALGFMSNLFGSLTHYGSGQAAVYYGAGFLDLKEVFKYGALMGAISFALWMGTGMVWWRIGGLF